MTSAEFNASLDALGWTREATALRLDCDTALVERWAAGTLPIPEQVAVWLTRWRITVVPLD